MAALAEAVIKPTNSSLESVSNFLSSKSSLSPPIRLGDFLPNDYYNRGRCERLGDDLSRKVDGVYA